MNKPLDHATQLIELERTQIGHEIHDVLLPYIFAASSGISALTARDPESDSVVVSREHLDRIASLLEEAMDKGRQLLTQLYPPELADTVWTFAAKDTLQRLFQGSVELEWDLEHELDSVGPPIALAVYRIVIEAVRNAVRHGKASHVKISGRCQQNNICIEIHDNGIGFEPSQVSSDRFGIRTMKSRAELVGGTVSIESNRQSEVGACGTTVSVSLPRHSMPEV